jgi:dihydropteroate synthase
MSRTRFDSLVFDLSKTVVVMGILNVTPDSFYDGGNYLDPARALDRALQMEEEGARIIDVGAESTRPGARPLSLEEELQRLLPLFKMLGKKLKVPFSVDTRKAEVARKAIEEGASLINDVSGFSFDLGMVNVLQTNEVLAVLMHSRGTPETMKSLTQYDSVAQDLMSFFEKRLQALGSAGIKRERLWIDPGIGFAKTPEQSLEILSQLRGFKSFGLPLMLGVSRKSFLDEYFGSKDPSERALATEMAHALAILNGANILRVHDVAAALKTARFVQQAKG